jgi:hypothetical protein
MGANSVFPCILMNKLPVGVTFGIYSQNVLSTFI